MTWTLDSSQMTLDSSRYTLDGGIPFDGSAADAQGETAAGVGLLLIAGLLTSAQAERAAGAGLSIVSALLTSAQAEQAAGAAISTIGALLASAQGETVSGAALAVTGAGLVTSAQGETAAGVGTSVGVAPLLAQSIVGALFPVFGIKVYPQVAPDQAAAPYAIYQGIVSTPQNTLNDGIPIENDRFQIDTYARTYIEGQRLSRACRDAMLAIPYPIGVVFTMQADQYAADVKLHRVIQDFSLWLARSNS